MSIAAAIFVIAAGAILRYATNVNVQGVNLDTVGLILMIAGAAGLVLSFAYEALASKRRREDAALVAEERRRASQAYAQQPQRADYDQRQPPRY